jgi:hypothetical protein
MAPIRSRRNDKKSRANNAQILRVVRSLAEKKVFNGGASSQTTSNSGTVWALSQGIIQGDAVNTRDGTQITLQSIHLRVDAFMPTATIASVIRVIVFTDSQNNGTLPSVLDVLHSTSVISPYSIIQQITNRFHVHSDVLKNTTAGGIQQVVFDVRRNMNSKISYNGTTDVAASNGKNGLFFLIITDVGSGFPTYDFTHSLRYLDM